MAQEPKRRRSPQLSKTTIRDFGGGLNVIDSEQNLTSRFSPVFDNCIRYADGSVSPRYGYEMFLDMRTGTEINGVFPASSFITFTALSPIVRLTIPAHSFVVGEHITLSGFPDSYGIPGFMINDTHSVLIIDANTIDIYMPFQATTTVTNSITGMALTRDNHALGGRIVRIIYFNDFILVCTSSGEILRVAEDRSIQILWSFPIANSLGGSPPPWSRTDIIAFDYWSGSVILCNGHDKPLRIDYDETNKIDYLVDPAMSSSNVAIPVFDAVKSAFRYLSVHDTDNTVDDNRTVTRISAKNTAVVYSGSTDPGDAVDVDVSKMLASPNSRIVAYAIIKNNLMVIMPTSTVLLRLGNYVTAGSDSVHEPIPNDTLSNFGTSAPNSVIEVGSDVFMLDFNGVPSARLSSLGDSIVPERVSQLIEPIISKHISRLSETTLRVRAFSTYDPKNKSIHFVLPRYDDDTAFSLDINPFVVNANNSGTKTVYVSIVGHCLEPGDPVLIAGVVDAGTPFAGYMNGAHTVVGVMSADVVVLEIYSMPTNVPTAQPQLIFGGDAVIVVPPNDESIVYLYHYVPSLKINCWSRFRTPRKLVSGCSTTTGSLYLADEEKLYRYGSLGSPMYGDLIGEFDAVWAISTAYTVGQRVQDPITKEVFDCTVAHTSAASPNNMKLQRLANPPYWIASKGLPIYMEWELPWADFGNRQEMKMLQYIHIDASGNGEFTVELFVDNIFKTNALGQRIPARQTTFVGQDNTSQGYDIIPPNSIRRTREEFQWAIPLRFKLLKIRIASYSTDSIRINAISFLYQRGGLQRT